MAGAITINYHEIRNPQLKKWIEEEFHDELFHVTTGHDHDGVNSPTLSPAAVIAAGSVATVAIVDAAVTAPKIGDAAVTTTKILDDAVTAAKIADGTIVVGLMAVDSIDSDQYVDLSIDTAHIGNLQVTTAKIAADAITGAQIADLAVDSEHIVVGAIDTAHIGLLQVTTAVLAANAVTTAKITDDNVTNDKLANITRGSIKVGGAANAPTDLVAKTSGYILVGDNTDVASVAVSGDVTLAANGAVTIAAVSVETGMIALDAITEAQVADNAINSEHYTDGSIDTEHLAAITTPTAKAIAAAHLAAIPVTGNGNVALTIANAAETNTLAVPTFAGQIITISADTLAGTGTRAITVATDIDLSGNNVITFNAAGEFISLYGIKLDTSFAWRILGSVGVVLS